MESNRRWRCTSNWSSFRKKSSKINISFLHLDQSSFLFTSDTHNTLPWMESNRRWRCTSNCSSLRKKSSKINI